MDVSFEDNGSPLIRLRNVSLAYRIKKGFLKRKLFWALKDISFDLYRGESLGVVGKNGCGKSTLLRVLAGIMAPDKGVVESASVKASLLSLGVGFVNHLSGRENAVLSGMCLGMRKREVEAKMERIIAYADIGGFIDEPVYTYSTGMRARLAFAVASQIEPDVLLVDEITGVGDAQFRKKSFNTMQEWVHSKRSTVVFVAHQANHIRQMCSRVLWIEQGELKMAGDTNTVLRAYKEWLENLDREV
jgi:lipopolysaccharide transport system ATP-binding protein